MEKINFKKKYGQNFLSDTNLLKAIVADSSLMQSDEVLEIGAGAGALTKIIAKNCQKLISYEIDEELKPVLENNLSEFNNIKLIFSDIMKINIKDIEKDFSGKYKIIANLPYYITTPIIFKFLEETDRVESLTIMVQKEVAEKILAKPKSSSYGILSVMCNYFTTPKISRIVKKQMFTPMPKVDSAIVVMKRKTVPYSEGFKKFVQSAFSMRRKTLVNNLLSLYPKNVIEDVLINSGYKLSVRAEELSEGEFENLFKIFDKKSIK